MNLEEEIKRLRAENKRLQTAMTAAETERDSFKSKLGRTLAERELAQELARLNVPAMAREAIARLALDGATFEEDGTIVRGASLQSAASLAAAAVKEHAAIIENARALERMGGAKGRAPKMQGRGTEGRGQPAGAWDPDDVRGMEREGLVAAANDMRANPAKLLQHAVKADVG